jgi:hypothetical protein
MWSVFDNSLFYIWADVLTYKRCGVTLKAGGIKPNSSGYMDLWDIENAWDLGNNETSPVGMTLSSQ